MCWNLWYFQSRLQVGIDSGNHFVAVRVDGTADEIADGLTAIRTHEMDGRADK